MNKQILEVPIIGAGPAGIACAIQLKRYNIDFIILEKDGIGGLLRNANLIENFPGFPNGISGKNMIKLLKKQISNADIKINYESVNSVNYINNKFKIVTQAGSYKSELLVVASGTKPIIPDTPKIYDDVKDKIFFDVYNLEKVRNKSIAIIGAGDCAFDYALNLHHNNNVIILNRSKRVLALPILQDRCFKSKNIKYLENISVEKIENAKDGLNLKCNNEQLISIDFLLLAIGRKSNLDFIKNNILLNSNVFQIGDVKNNRYQQMSIAVGDGTFTAMHINTILN